MENLQPKLRFPEFKEDWKKTVFSNLIDVIDGDRGKSYPKSTEFSENGFCLFLNAKNVTKNGFNFNTLNFISEEKDKELNKGKLIKEDLVLTTRGTVGNFAYYNNEIILEHIRINSGMVILRINSTKILNSKYLYKYTSSNTLSKTIENVAFGSAQPQLTVKEIKKFPLSYPTLQEQSKIADFLGAVDKQLDILNQKKEKLNLYKKGVMQQLFSQQICFKDDNGNDFPEWEEKTLGEVLKYTQPNRFIVKSTDYNDSYNTPVLTAGKSFLLGYTNETDNIYKDIPCIIFDDFTTSSQFVDFNFKIKSSAMKILNTIGEDNIKFLFELINTIQFPKGDEHKRYWISEYSKLVLNIPSIAEQTKIAEFLSAIDTQIQAVENQITKTETYKKGLLQQMFV